MLELIAVVGLIVLLLFAGVVLFGAPYVPSLRPQITTALDLLDLQPGEMILEIGSGDGRVLLAAAERSWAAVGYEINPILVLIARWRLRNYKNVRVLWRNAWRTPWQRADGVYVFGLQRLLPKVCAQIAASNTRPVKLVSVGFSLADVEPEQEANGVFLYSISACKPTPVQLP